jgi:DNA modification methylase
MAFLIDALTKPGEIILDCFCGTGSTLVAARQLGRPWIGCDKSKWYCQVARGGTDLVGVRQVLRALHGMVWRASGVGTNPVRAGPDGFGNIWVVQTRDQQPIPFPPDRDAVIFSQGLGRLREWHPCAKTVEEMLFLVESLSAPGQIVLDPFCGTGSTLVAAQRLGRRWIGCDLSRKYCQIALWRLDMEQAKVVD